MFGSLLVAIALSGVFTPSAEAGVFSSGRAGRLDGDGELGHSFGAGLSGRVESAAADRRGGGKSGGQGRPSSGGQRSGGQGGGQGGRSGGQGGADRAPSQPSQPARPSGPPDRGGSDNDRASRDAPSQPAPQRSEPGRPGESRPGDGRPDDGRPDGASRPDAGRPDGGAPGQPVDRAPGAPRPVEGARPAPGRPEGAHPVNRGAPSNFRGAPGHPHPGAPAPNAPPMLRHQQAEQLQRNHQAAARAHHRGNGHVYAHHAEADRWRSAYWDHRHGPAPRYRWYRPRTWFVTWYPGRPHYWYHGVFVYGPPPYYHGESGGGGGSAAPAPERKVNHAGDWSVGLRSGSYLSGYNNGASFGDFGLGLAARYRVAEPVGFELQWMYHDDTWQAGTERIETPLSASVQLFAFPWSKFNPYVLAGVTATNRNVQDDIGAARVVDDEQSYWGPHLGVGLELGLSQKTSLNFDARFMGYLNHDAADAAAGGATQLNAGLNFYF